MRTTGKPRLRPRMRRTPNKLRAGASDQTAIGMIGKGQIDSPASKIRHPAVAPAELGDVRVELALGGVSAGTHDRFHRCAVPLL